MSGATTGLQKFGRNYTLTITSPTFKQPLVVSLPFTIEFDITRNTLTSANVCSVRLYNLSTANRNAIRRPDTQYGEPYWSIELKAGYGTAQKGSTLPTIFSGNVSQAWSIREGVNFITQIECYDGGFAFVNAQIPPQLANVPKGTPYKTLITNLIQSLPNVTLGVVGNFTDKTPRANTYTGSTIEVLQTLTGGGFFIDNGVGNALGNSEYSMTTGPIFKINAASGLLNTPLVEGGKIRYDIIFEPNLVVGSAATIESKTLDKTISQTFSGNYKITSVKHRGTISQTVCGNAITTAEFFYIKGLKGVAA